MESQSKKPRVKQWLKRSLLSAALLCIAAALTWVLFEQYGSQPTVALIIYITLWHVCVGGGIGAMFGDVWMGIRVAAGFEIFAIPMYFTESMMQR